MQDNEQVFLYMKEEIERLAKKEEAELVDAMNKSKEEIHEQLVLEAKKEAELEYDAKLKDIKRETSSDNVEKSAEYTKKLVEKREEYVQSVMNEVKQKILTFVDSKDYLPYLLKSLQTTKDSYTLEQPVLSISKEDMKYKEELLNVYGKELQIKECLTPIIGGYILEDSTKGLYVDQTFDFILRNQETWFYDNSGFTLK